MAHCEKIPQLLLVAQAHLEQVARVPAKSERRGNLHVSLCLLTSKHFRESPLPSLLKGIS